MAKGKFTAGGFATTATAAEAALQVLAALPKTLKKSINAPSYV